MPCIAASSSLSESLENPTRSGLVRAILSAVAVACKADGRRGGVHAADDQRECQGKGLQETVNSHGGENTVQPRLLVAEEQERRR